MRVHQEGVCGWNVRAWVRREGGKAVGRRVVDEDSQRDVSELQLRTYLLQAHYIVLMYLCLWNNSVTHGADHVHNNIVRGSVNSTELGWLVRGDGRGTTYGLGKEEGREGGREGGR